MVQSKSTFTVVPATPGSTVIGFSLFSEEPYVVADPYTVLAWRIEIGEHGDVEDLEPITIESLPIIWCFVEEHGNHRRYVFPEDCDFETLDAASSYAAEKFQRRNLK